MSIETDLSVSPYFDEAAAGIAKNYYKVLFKPSVPVQVRELNELQSILQNQIEEFGDNILKQGTIVRGCKFSFLNTYPYIKIKDSQVDGAPVNVSSFQGDFVTSSTGQRAKILNFADGFESTAPDTKTLYVKYINSGHSGNSTTFSAGQQLTVQNGDLGITNVTIDTRGTGYSNSATVVFVSAVSVINVTGTLTVGSTMTQPDTGANAVIVSINSTAYSDRTVLTLRPVTADFTDSAKTSSDWTFKLDKPIQDSSNSSVTAVPFKIIGSGASAVVTTDSAQRVSDISMTSYGTGYNMPPYVAVRSTTGGSGASLTALNYKARITIMDTSNPIGSGYAFKVSDGVIYQKGYFLNVPSQTVIVSRYSQYPNNVSVGFQTFEDIIDAYEDTDLLDNAIGTRNYTAPGADRLQLTPQLFVTNTDIASANLDFFSIVEFSEGVPYKQNQTTSYNVINDEMARRTYESAGDFVTDQFLVACKSTTNAAMAANTFTVVVDPGTAYVKGYKVQNYGNYQYTLDKGIDTKTEETANVSLDYGSYVVVDNMAGSFDFSQIGLVSLYNVAGSYLSNSSLYTTGTISAPGTTANRIGFAKIRQIQYVDSDSSGSPQGSPSSRYRAYLFDIQLYPGRSFREVKSIFYDGATYKGIADIVLDNLTSAGGQATTGAVLKKTMDSSKKTLDKMIFYSGVDSPLAINNISYTYRKFDDNGAYALSNSGVIQITLSGDEYFPYTGDLSDSQKKDLVFMPLAHAYANLSSGGSGQVNIDSSSNTLTSSNSSFTASLKEGDYVRLSSNSTGGTEIRRVVKIVPGTSLTLDANSSFTNATGTVTRAFPKYVPLPILTRSGITANVSVDSRTLTINIGTRLEGTSFNLASAFNISVSNSSITTKTANRNLFVKIYPANNTTGFGYSEYGSGVDGYFTSGSNAVSNTVTTNFSANQQIKIVRAANRFDAQVNSITNSTHMTLKSTVNFTGNADIYSAINSNGPWCLGVADIFRLRAVYVANTSAVNVNSTNVTRDFVIDHNHTTNFADLGYLVKNKNSSLVIGPNDYLLVQFDAFTRSTEGRPVLVNSYVDSNAVTRANVDSKPLSNLNNSYINTLEIPEIHASTGMTYDLINHIDFRPSVSNTANLSTTVAGATLNPAYTVAFSASDKKFPVPESQMSYRVKYFMGRVDAIFIGPDGRVGTKKGKPLNGSSLNSLNTSEMVKPLPEDGSMLLNYIKIPPYPSIEENMGGYLPRILDKRVINEVTLNKRIRDRGIKKLMDDRDVSINQPRGYSMKEIGSLERRIRDLEYYVSLTLLETSIKDLNLPSSISPSFNRFKFGFFADDFNDNAFSDTSSIEYAASISDGRVLPTTEKISFVVPKVSDSFTDYSVVKQLKSTATGPSVTGPNVTGPSVTGPSVTGPSVTGPVVDQVCIGYNKDEWGWDRSIRGVNASGNSTEKLTEWVRYKMASKLGNNPGTVTIYLWGGSSGMTFEAKQSTIKNASDSVFDDLSPVITAASAKKLTAADIAYIRSIPGSYFWRLSDQDLTNHSITADGKLKFAGKITFAHNPANGTNYRLRGKATDESYFVRAEYPVNVDCSIGGPTGPGTGTSIGVLTLEDVDDTVMVSTSLDSFDVDFEHFSSNDPFGGILTDRMSATYYKIHFFATSLRPSTWHKVFLNQKDVTNLVDTSVDKAEMPVPPPFAESKATWDQYSVQIPDVFSDAPLGYVMTDASGKLEAFLYLLSDEKITREPLIGTKQNPVTIGYGLSETVKNPTIEIKSDDGQSRAHAVAKFSYKLFNGIDWQKYVAPSDSTNNKPNTNDVVEGGVGGKTSK